MDTVAFALRAEHEGTVEVDHGDGELVEVPKFGGGVLAVGDGDFHLKDQLEAGDGVIVVQANDQALIDLLRAIPVLKEVATPEGATPINPYERRDVEGVRAVAQIRGIKGAASTSKEKLLPILAAHDEALALGDLAAANQIAEDPGRATDVGAAQEASGAAPVAHDGGGDSSPGEIAVDSLTVAQLAAVLDSDTEEFEHAGHVEVPAALDELRSRAKEGDDDAQRALIARDITDRTEA